MIKKTPPKTDAKEHFDWNTLELDTSNIPKCDHFGCDREGHYPAPKSLQTPQDRYYFCLEHVKAYNDQWDYAEQLKKAGDEYDPNHTDPNAPHNPFKSGFSRRSAGGFYAQFSQDNIDDPHDILGKGNDRLSLHDRPRFVTPKYFSPKTPEGRAFKTLELNWPFNEKDLKTAYKRLAKQHHPDLNQQASESLEKFRTIKEAFELLSQLLKTVYGSN